MASALGTALGLAISHTWVQIVAALKAVVNRGTLNWSGSNAYYDMPAGYYSGGRLDSRPSYTNGYNAGIAAGKVTNIKELGNTSHNLTTAISYTMIGTGIFIAALNANSSRLGMVTVYKNESPISPQYKKSSNSSCSVIIVLVNNGDVIKMSASGTAYMEIALNIY